jgi:hypothetical protein
VDHFLFGSLNHPCLAAAFFNALDDVTHLLLSGFSRDLDDHFPSPLDDLKLQLASAVESPLGLAPLSHIAFAIRAQRPPLNSSRIGFSLSTTSIPHADRRPPRLLNHLVKNAPHGGVGKRAGIGIDEAAKNLPFAHRGARRQAAVFFHQSHFNGQANAPGNEPQQLVVNGVDLFAQIVNLLEPGPAFAHLRSSFLCAHNKKAASSLEVRGSSRPDSLLAS